MDQEKDRRDDLDEEKVYFDGEEAFEDEPTAEDWQDAPRKQAAPQDPIEQLHRLITEMIDYVGNAKRGLFSQSVLVDREIMIDNLDRIWEMMPAAVTEGEEVLKDRDRILQEAREHANNVTRDAENKASQKTIDAENIANRTIQDANAYYAEHKTDGDAYLAQRQDEGDAYLKRRQQEGDAYVRDRKAEAENYVRQTVQSADAQANGILADAQRKHDQLVAQENVMIAAEAAAQALKNQAEAEYAARVSKAEEDANTLYGSAYTQTQKLLRELGEFQKKQNQELRVYCEELEKRHEQPMGRQA